MKEGEAGSKNGCFANLSDLEKEQKFDNKTTNQHDVDKLGRPRYNKIINQALSLQKEETKCQEPQKPREPEEKKTAGFAVPGRC